MISIVITSFNEPKTIGKAIESVINQKIPEDYELIVVAPDKETLSIVREYSKKNKSIKTFKDPGKGKSYALNLVLPQLKGDIIVLSDGDVFVGQDSIQNILSHFKDPSVGAVTGRVLPQNPREELFGFWSHFLCEAAHRMRKKRHSNNQFLECSGYFWAFRKKYIKKFPTDVAEDSIVPLLLWEKGLKIAYEEKAEVYVKFPTNLNDFLKQKIRTAKSHQKLSKYVTKKPPKMKSFSNEAKGAYLLFTYPRNIKEFLWLSTLFPIRLYIWVRLFYLKAIKKQEYKDGWERIESTK